MATIQRLWMGHYIAPDDFPDAGHRIVLLAYLIRHADGIVLFDTGIGSRPDTDARNRPFRRPLEEALADARVTVHDIGLVANCHLHLDHAGQNDKLAGVPTVAQSIEAAAAREPDYTATTALDFPGLVLREIDGEVELAPGVRVVPTPGHTPGHQSLLVETDDGLELLAGQSYETASEFAKAYYAWRLWTREGDDTLRRLFPDWLPGVAERGIVRARFAHDFAIWEGDG